MKMIWNHINEDFSRIKSNSIVLVVIMGISLIPCLYAWFNIGASWDPYEETKGIRIAVVNDDKGYTPTLIKTHIVIGDKIKLNLGVNEQMDWIFTERNDAIEGVRSGKYYAAIVIPPDFSEKMFSFTSSKAEAPSLHYYVNEKKNAIAPKVTGKGAGAVTETVRGTFIETLYATSFESLMALSDETKSVGDGEMWQALQEQLRKSSDALAVQESTLRSFQSLARSSGDVLATGEGFMDLSEKTVKDGMKNMEANKKDLQTMRSSLESLNRSAEQALDKNLNYMNALSGSVDELFAEGEKSRAETRANGETMVATLEKDINDKKEIGEKICRLNTKLPIPLRGLDRARDKILRSIEYEEMMVSSLKRIVAKDEASDEKVQNARREFLEYRDRNVNNLKSLRRDFSENIVSKYGVVENDFDSVRTSMDDLWGDAGGSVDSVRSLSGDIQRDLDKLSGAMDESIALLNGAKGRVDDLYDRTVALEHSDGVEKLNLFLKQDTEDLSRFLSGPVGTNTHRLYPVENYGSGMAAFYTTLSLWVGAVIQVALINVSTPKSYIEKYGEFKPHETYFGRLTLFIAISLIQSTFITLGNLYFLGVQCLHPGYFLLASWVAGMIFTILIYTLTISFGDIGKALCVVLMVIQVAGSGGTFPIDVAPSFFRKLYDYLPFVHSMNAMKETIAGFYGNTYFKELMILQVYFAASLLLGLVLRKPLMHLNEVFEEKLEDTKLM